MTSRTRIREPLPQLLPMTWHNTRTENAFSDKLVMGLDLSLTSTGAAFMVERLLLSTALTPKKLVGVERLAWYYDTITHLVYKYKPHHAVIESYAHEAKWGREFQGELGGVVRLALHQNNVPYTTYAPSQLKKFATGTGKADKNIVARELFKRYNVDAEGNDEVDACGLALMGAARLGYQVTMTATQREAVEKVEK